MRSLYPCPVSTDLQADHGYSLGEQTERIEAYCKAKEWDLAKVYTDPGFTGSNMDRPALQDLINDIKQYDIVVVNKLDRLSRNQKDTLTLVQDVFAPNGVSFVSLEESFDTTTPLGIAMLGILSAFAQLERSQIKERLKMGKKGRAKKGLWHGGSQVPIGYDFIDGQLVKNEDAPQIQLIFDMYLQGKGIRDIARYMTEHYTNKYSNWNCLVTIRNILQNPIYIGMINDYKGQHEPIISDETFESVQLILQDHKLGKKVATSTHLLTGSIFCAYCGSRVTISSTVNKKTGTRYAYYRCGCTDSGQIKKIDNRCKLKSQKESVIDDIVINEILKLRMDNVEIVDNNVDIVDNSVEIAKIEKQLKRLIDLYSICDEDKIGQIAQKIKDLSKRQRLLEDEMKVTKKPSEKKIMETLKVAHKTLKSGSKTEKKRIVDALINRVILSNDAVKIEWKFF